MAAAGLGMILNFSACSFGGEQNDVEQIQDVESLESADMLGGDDALLSDTLPEDSLGDVASTPPPAEAPNDEFNFDAAATTPDTSALPDAPPPMSFDDSAATETPPSDMSAEPTDSFAMNDEPAESSDFSEPPPAPAPKTFIPLQKVAETPWKSGSRWVNAIYFARPGDTLDGISQMLYGEDRTDELQRINPTYKTREPRPGDKVYYSSTRRPDDSSQILTWHEENGIAPQVYVTQEGENIRTLSQQLLGYEGAWKEVWSSNAVESKTTMTAGTELRYWPAAPAGQQMAANNMDTPPATDSMQMPPSGEMPPAADLPPPVEDMAQNQLPAPGDLPPPPSMDGMSDLPPPPDMAMGDLPPPPPPMDNFPPPPPPPAPEQNMAGMSEESGQMDEDTMMALGVVAAAAAGIAALLVIRRRRKQKEMENQFGETHVGT